MLWVIIRYRRRDDALPPQKHYNIPMEIAYTVIPLLDRASCCSPSPFVTVDAIDDSDADARPRRRRDRVPVAVAVRLPRHAASPSPAADGENPELVLPASSTVRFDLASPRRDPLVLDPGVPLQARHDPGQRRARSVSTSPTSPGHYPNTGVCAEFCGLDHASMRFSVRILPPDEFEAWLADQRADSAAAEEAT